MQKNERGNNPGSSWSCMIGMIVLAIFPPKIWSWKSHQGSGRRSFNPLYKEREYMQYELRKQYSGDLLKCPLSISYEFYFQPPISISKKTREAMIRGEIKHTKKVDVTNCLKFTEDCLKGIVIEDDCYVVHESGTKHYGEKCSIIIKIKSLLE
jgi:Holliday junction resolvase RusA-like endonuclease